MALITWIIASAKPKPEISLELFEGVFVARGPRGWRCFLASVLLHCLLVFVVPPGVEYLTFSEEKALLRKTLLARPLEIRLPDKLYLASRRAPARPAKRKRAPKQPPEPVAAQVEPKVRKPAPRRFELPELPRSNVAQTLLQPQFPPDLPLPQQIRLPQAMFWTAAIPKLPRPAPKPFIVPGHTERVTSMPTLDAPPKLELPNRELATADLKMTGLLLNRQPLLPRRPATTMPLRTFQAPARRPPQGAASLDPFPGDPSSFLSLSSHPARLGESLILPPGNQLGRMPEAPLEPASNVPSPATAPATTTTPAEAGANGGEAAKDAEAASAGQPAEPVLASAAAVAIRMVHPVNNTFDVVVVQSSAAEAFPEGAGILTGKPVYTVYLQVGAPKEWLLEYTIPEVASDSPPGAGYVVRIENPAPLKAPYPLLTVVPPFTLEPRSSYLLVHGFLDIGGRFKQLTLLRQQDPRTGELVLPFLEKWEFRPATKDGRPILVEILLAIPPNQT